MARVVPTVPAGLQLRVMYANPEPSSMVPPVVPVPLSLIIYEPDPTWAIPEIVAAVNGKPNLNTPPLPKVLEDPKYILIKT